jgi:hypothetical protein
VTITTDPAAFVMPFGRHKGKPLREVPRGYLRWCLENVAGLQSETRAAMTAFMGRPAASAASIGASRAPRPRPRHTTEAEAAPRCGVCGLAGTGARPLVNAMHAACAADDVPF